MTLQACGHEPAMNNFAEPLKDHPLYEPEQTIGKGQRSFVQVARSRATGERVAIKFIPRGWDHGQTKYIIREILNHQELSLSKHPHVVEFKEVFLTPRYLAEVLEYVEGETLQVFLEKVGGKVIEGLARFIFQQLIIALDFCHRKGKINRDIKLSNILLSIAEGQLPLLKLCDFGFSKDTYRHSEPHSQVGTALFVAPEVIQNVSGGRYDGMAADVWACGVCLFIMVFGRHPYLRPEDSKLSEQQQMIKLFQRMMQSQIEFPQDQVTCLSVECVDLLTRMLKTDPNQRYTMADIQRHVWFTTALPEGASLMNDLFLAEESSSLSPQSQSQIEALVALAAKQEDMLPTRVQLPSQLPANMPIPGAMPSQPVPMGSMAMRGGPLPPGPGPAQMAGSPGAPYVAVPPQQPLVAVPAQTTNPMLPPQALQSQPHAMLGVQPALPTPPGVNSQLLPTRTQLQTPSLQAPYPQQDPSGYPTPAQYGQPQQMSPPQQPYFPPQLQTQPQQQGSVLVGSNFVPHETDAALFQLQQQHLQQQQQLQQLQQAQLAGLSQAAAAPVSAPHAGAGATGAGAVDLIPDLDAMIMNMPETALLQAATVDLRAPPPPAGAAATSTGPSQPQPGLSANSATPSGGVQAPSNASPQPQPTQQRMFTNSISSLAPGSVSLPSTSGLSLNTPPGLDSGFMTAGSMQLQPQTSQSLVVDPTPFLYEGSLPDDELPMIGSVSQLLPKFDWGSFNTPALANHDTLQASGFFQSSAFTQMCNRLARDSVTRSVTSNNQALGLGNGSVTSMSPPALNALQPPQPSPLGPSPLSRMMQ